MPQAAVPQSARASAALAGQPTPLGVPRASWAPSAEPPQTLHLIPRLVKSLGILNGQSSEVGDGHVLCALPPAIAAGDGHGCSLAALNRLNLRLGLALIAAVLRQRVVELRRRDAHLQRLHRHRPSVMIQHCRPQVRHRAETLLLGILVRERGSVGVHALQLALALCLQVRARIPVIRLGLGVCRLGYGLLGVLHDLQQLLMLRLRLHLLDRLPGAVLQCIDPGIPLGNERLEVPDGVFVDIGDLGRLDLLGLRCSALAARSLDEVEDGLLLSLGRLRLLPGLPQRLLHVLMLSAGDVRRLSSWLRLCSRLSRGLCNRLRRYRLLLDAQLLPERLVLRCIGVCWWRRSTIRCNLLFHQSSVSSRSIISNRCSSSSSRRAASSRATFSRKLSTSASRAATRSPSGAALGSSGSATGAAGLDASETASASPAGRFGAGRSSRAATRSPSGAALGSSGSATGAAGLDASETASASPAGRFGAGRGSGAGTGCTDSGGLSWGFWGSARASGPSPVSYTHLTLPTSDLV